jgi:type I restriction enzyme R subunit
MSQTPTEKRFEEHIEAHLLNSGYRKLSPDGYDLELCLIPNEVIGFIRDTQPQEYERLEVQYGAETPAKISQRISQEITKRGTLDVIRKGIKDRGVTLHLAFFRPSSGMNPEHLILYRKNRLTIVRQLAFSKKYHGTLDVTIFLNGLPTMTAELKNSLTGQFVEDAIKQYKTDRKPDEPLFKFKRCLVHFAVGNELVFMTTRLEGDSTRFLPFNKDTVNPVNDNGFKTAYLWEDILQPDVLLSLLNSYLHIQLINEKYYDKTKGLIEVEHEVLIFPRYHQLDSVRKMLSALKTEGVGKTYLIQHSAGSGKSNSIAWLAHQLASYYQSDSTKERLFDSIIVVTDRKNLDRQLQNTIKQFEQTRGVVHPIDENSAQLKKALENGKDIIITTLQKFPRISETIADLKGKKFAVIVDEAHTSQTGETSKHLKKALATSLEDAEEEDQDESEFDLEDAVLDEIKTRGRQPNISYFAFTATPKNKTLELFGRKNSDGKFEAFHTYSMRQAIEERFILDVLANYTTFERYFKLVKSIPEDNEYEQKKTVRLLTHYVDLQPHAIESKTRIMLDHFLDVTVHAIQGRGRAMLVTRSRLHAVKYFLMFQKVMAEKHLPFKALVAFSGTVKDPDTDKEHTENGLNHLPPKVKIEDAFKTPEYRILIVANKFQTGFDEPLLHTMYVDKKLGGVNAVQTLSRLNRTAKGKKETVVLDFVNEWEAIQKSFQEYYQRVVLEQETDPNKLYELERKLMVFGVFSNEDVEAHAKIYYDPKGKG